MCIGIQPIFHTHQKIPLCPRLHFHVFTRENSNSNHQPTLVLCLKWTECLLFQSFQCLWTIIEDSIASHPLILPWPGKTLSLSCRQYFILQSRSFTVANFNALEELWSVIIRSTWEFVTNVCTYTPHCNQTSLRFWNAKKFGILHVLIRSLVLMPTNCSIRFVSDLRNISLTRVLSHYLWLFARNLFTKFLYKPINLSSQLIF